MSKHKMNELYHWVSNNQSRENRQASFVRKLRLTILRYTILKKKKKDFFVYVFDKERAQARGWQAEGGGEAGYPLSNEPSMLQGSTPGPWNHDLSHPGTPEIHYF